MCEGLLLEGRPCSSLKPGFAQKCVEALELISLLNVKEALPNVVVGLSSTYLLCPLRLTGGRLAAWQQVHSWVLKLGVLL